MLPRFVIAATLLATFLAPLPAQQRRVVVSNPDERAIRLIALRNHLCVDQVVDARRALKYANGLATELDPRTLYQFSQLGRYWQLLYPDEADGKVEEIVKGLRRRAAQAVEPNEYQLAFQAANQLVQTLESRRRPVDRLVALLEDWPEGPARSEQWLEQTRRNFERNRRYQTANRDPVAAYEDLPGVEAGEPDWNLRAQLMGQLMSRGELEMAESLADETLGLLEGADFDRNNMHVVTALVGQLAGVSPERFDGALDLLLTQAQLLDQQNPAASVKQSWYGTELEMSQGESYILNTLQSLGNRPKTVLHVLDQVPSLAEKIEGIGGIDQLLGGYHYARRQAADPMQRLQMELSNADADTILARIGSGSDPAEIQILVNSAQRFCQEPDQLERVLGAAADRVQQLDTNQASNYLTQLIQTSSRCLGEVDQRLESEARLVIDDIHSEEEATRQRRPLQGRFYGYNSAADHLEVELAVADVRFEFDKTAGRIAELDEPVQFLAWMRALQVLTSR